MEGAIVTTDAMGVKKTLPGPLSSRAPIMSWPSKTTMRRCMVRCNCFSTTSRPIRLTTSPLSIIPPSTPLTSPGNAPLLAHIGYRVLRRKELVSPDCQYWSCRVTRRSRGDVSIEPRYFLTSLACDAVRFAQAVREHWGVENALHWSSRSAFVKTIVAFAKTMAHKIWRPAPYGAESIATRIRP